MVIHLLLSAHLLHLTLAESAVREKLPPPTRAAAMMALIGIALLGMLLVVIILLGGHWVRRQGSYRRGQAVPPDRRPIVGEGSPTSPSSAQSAPAANDDAATGAAETVITRDTHRDEKRSP